MKPSNLKKLDDWQIVLEVKIWQEERNAKIVKVDWRFTMADARIKLKHLYPVIHKGLPDGKTDA